MEVQEQIQKLTEFVDTFYKEELIKQINKDRKYLYLDFSELIKFSPEIADELLYQPEETIKAAEIAIEQFDTLGDVNNFKARFFNLPVSHKVMLRDIRATHLNKFLLIEGTVRQKSDVRPQVISAKFECPSCGNVINVLQLESKFREPSKCGCGRKGKFRLMDKEMVDAQGIVLEESSEDLEGGEQPKRMNILLKNDLVSPISEKKTNPGAKIRITGILKEVPILAKDGGKLTRFDLMIEVNYVEPIEEDFSNLEITSEEEQQILDLAADPKVKQKLLNSIVPGIYGHEMIKEAVLLLMAGGVRKVREDGSITRGDIHILLVGDPGAGKCAHPNTKIMLEDGRITTISSFYDKNISFSRAAQDTMGVFSINENGLNSASQPTKFWRRKSPAKMLKITTNSGNELIVTKEHPLFTTEDGLIFAKQASDYKTGDYIATPSKIIVKGEIQHISSNVEPSRANNKVKYKIKEIFDRDFARLFGYLVGDGYTRFMRASGVISFTNNNPDLLGDFERLIKSVFGLQVKKRKKQNSSSYEYYTSSIELVRILEKIDKNITKKSQDMCIADTITRSPDYILKEFIKALFDCEGHIRKGRREIEFSSKSKNLIMELKCLLLRFGIVSQVSSAMKYAANTKHKIKRRYYMLRISGEEAVIYSKEIGFISKEKQEQLEKAMQLDKCINTNLNVVPNLKGLLKTIRHKYMLSQFDFKVKRTTYQHYERGDRFPSYRKLKEICEKYETFDSNDHLIEILKQAANADIFWDKIKKIEMIDSDSDYVYDLEIENVHNYVADGVVIHNSQILKRVGKIAPKGRFVSGKGASGAGLTASVVKDEFMSGWSLEAGALVLANRGICCIDELDKMSKEDRDSMHEALEGQTVTISKANIQATLRAETTVLAAANPKFGRFDPYEIIPKQIDLPSTLINRFDLIFPVKDLPDKDKDDKLASFILNLHQSPNMIDPDIDAKLLRKYFAYARQRCNPQLTDGAIEEIKKYYLKMRSSGSEEGGVKAIPISARQLEALVRMTEATAKLGMKKKAERKDAKNAIELMHHCLVKIGLDPDTGKIDIDRISTGIPASERSHISTIKEIINDLEKKLGKTIPIDDIMEEAKGKGIEEEKIEETIQKLKRAGDVFEPRHGFLSKI